MGDPLSVAAGVAGLVSLGLTVCSGLLDYYSAWKDLPTDVSNICGSLATLKAIFQLLDRKVRGSTLDRESVEVVTNSMMACAVGVGALELKLKKFGDSKPGLSAHLHRAKYPFQQKTVEKLGRTISELRSNLTLATITLQLDVSITSVDVSTRSLNRLDKVDKNLSDLKDKTEISDTKILDGVSKVIVSQEQEKLRALSIEERNIINWLSPLEFFSKQIDALGRREEGTGQWLLDTVEFRSWLDTARQILWCPGMPGAGKTVLSSIVIDYLRHNYREEKIGIAFVYCVHNGTDQTACNFLGSLLQQLAMQSVEISDDIKSCHRHHAQLRTRPSLSEIATLLRSQVQKFNKVFIVIDALDECPELAETRKEFLAAVRSLVPTVRLMVTSRHILSIESIFKHDTRLEIQAQDHDVRKFIESQMERRDGLVDLLKDHEDVRSRIITGILSKTNGMFLLAALHMDSLAREDNVRELKECLQRLPEDLDRTYDDALERIKLQDHRKQARADQVLTLINCARRPLKTEELRQALSIRQGDTSLDPQALPQTESLISSCCGLVVLENESQIVRLVHYTTEEYFKRKVQRYRSPKAHQYFAEILIAYLNFDVFTAFSLDEIIENARNAKFSDASVLEKEYELDERESLAVYHYTRGLIESNPLLQYAAENWGHHARSALTNVGDDPDFGLATTGFHHDKADNLWNLKQLMQNFLAKEQNVACANEVSHYLELMPIFPELYPRGPLNVTNLQIAAVFGIQYLVKECISQGAEIDARDSNGMTALHKAAKHGQVEVVRLLLEAGAEAEVRDRNRDSAFTLAVSQNEVSVSRLLLQIESNATPKAIREAFDIAAERCHERSLELLADLEIDDTRRNEAMGYALIRAVESKRESVVRFLLRGRTRWSISEQRLADAMIQAASSGHVPIIEILLEAGVDVRPPLGIKSLQEAVVCGHSEATGLLLTAGVDPNETVQGDDDTVLHKAVRSGNARIVVLLLEAGANVDVRDSQGDTAMVVRAQLENGYTDSVLIVQKLLEHGASAAATDHRYNRTPLELAVLKGHEDLVQLLLQYGSFSATRKDQMLYLAKLYRAIRESNDEAVDRLLLEQEDKELRITSKLLLIYLPAERGYGCIVRTFLQLGAAVEATTDLGQTALHLAAKEGHIEIVQFLIDKAANVNSRDLNDVTPLMMATGNRRTEVLRTLLEHGADINATSTRHPCSAVARAVNADDTATARLLLEKGADPNSKFDVSDGETLVHAAICLSYSRPMLELLLEKGADLEAKDSYSQTALLVAVLRGGNEPVSLLLEKGANVEAKDRYGKTALSLAVRYGYGEYVSLLLEEGANLEAKDSYGGTALLLAAKYGRDNLVSLLLEKGANLEAKNNDGETALVVAVRHGKCKLVQVLLERGADPRALSPTVTVKEKGVYKYDFDDAVKIVLDAQAKARL